MGETLRLAITISAFNNFSTAFMEASRGLTGFNAAIAGTTAGLAAAGAQFAIMAGQELVDFTKSVINTAATFEKEMLRVQVVSGMTTAQMEEMKQTALDLGSTMEWSAQIIAESFTSMGLAGFSAAEMQKVIPVALDLATASVTPLNDAVAVLITLLRSYGFEASEAARISNYLAVTATQTFTDVKDLGNSFKMVAPLAKTAGIPIEDLSAAIGLLGDAGLRGTLAGTSLRQAMTKLLSPTDAAYKAMESLNLSFYYYNEQGQLAKETLANLIPESNKLEAAITSLKDEQMAMNYQTIGSKIRMAELSVQIGQLKNDIDKTNNSLLVHSESIVKLRDSLSIASSQVDKFSTAMQVINLKTLIHESSLSKIKEKYSEWRGNLDALQSDMGEVQVRLDHFNNLISSNNLQIDMHQFTIDRAKESYVEWRGDIDKLEAQLNQLRDTIRGFDMEQKKNQISIMEIKQNADRVGRELALEETVRMNYLSEKNDELAIKKEKASLKEMAAEDALSKEKQTADAINQARMARIMESVSLEVAAIDELKRKNEELQSMNAVVSLEKLDLIMKIRAEEEKVTAENEKRLAIYKTNAAAEIAILDELAAKKDEIAVADAKLKLEQIQLSEALNLLELSNSAAIVAANAERIKKLGKLEEESDALTSAMEEQNVVMEINRLKTEMLNYENSILNKQISEATYQMKMGVIGLVSITEMIRQLEQAEVSAAQMTEIFGTRGGIGMEALYQRGSVALEALTEKILDSEGAVKSMADMIRTSGQTEMEKLTNTWSAAKTEIGLGLIPSLIVLVDALKGIIPAIAPIIAFGMQFYAIYAALVVGALQPFIDVLGPIFQLLTMNEGVMKAIGAYLIMSLLPVFGTFLVAMWAVNAVLDVLGVDFKKIGVFIAKLGEDLFNWLIYPFVQIYEIFVLVWKIIGNLGVWDKLNKAIKDIGGTFKWVYDEWIKPLWEGLEKIANVIMKIVGITGLGDIKKKMEKIEEKTRKEEKPEEETAQEEGNVSITEFEALKREGLSAEEIMAKYRPYEANTVPSKQVNIDTINVFASGEEEGRKAARAIADELRYLELTGAAGEY